MFAGGRNANFASGMWDAIKSECFSAKRLLFAIMAFYEINLAVLVIVNAALLYKQRHRREPISATGEVDDDLDGKTNSGQQDCAIRFKREFYPAYVLVFAADWLQVHKVFKALLEGVCTDSPLGTAHLRSV